MQMINDELDRNVLHIILRHRGKQNAIGRWELVAEVFGVPVPVIEQNDDHLQDRDIRYAVGRLRKEGHLICDMGDGRGRYLAVDEKEFWEFYAYFTKPIRAKADVARALKTSAEREFPNLMQPSLFDLAEVERV